MPSHPADFEETQPIESPRSVDDAGLIDPRLFGETQALDDPDCDDLGICDWGKTQLVDDDYQDADEGSERTAVLSDGEGLSDDGASHCEGETKVGLEEMGSEKKDFLVDLDASTDNERCKGIPASSSPILNGGSYKSNCGPARRNFTSVRAASLRASGLAARIVTPTNPNFSSCDVESSEVQVEHVSRLSCKRVLDFDSSPSAEADLISHNVQKVEERNETKGRSNCTSIKQPFNEVTPEEEEMTSNLCAGLTYVQSQEPGSQSQVNALDFVDNFLLINEIGSSQDVKTDNAHVVKSTPISTAKGTRTLAQRVDLRSPVGKIEIFEWDDRLEDDGGGDFFRRKKELFFEKKDKSQKSQSLPAKSQRCCLGTTERTMQKVVEKKGPNPKSNFKIGISTSSDSKLMLRSSLINDKTRVSIKAKNNLDKAFDEISRAKHLGQQLEATGDDEDAAVHVVGPDTQMAAEAMEALGQNLSISDSKEDAPPFAGIAEKSSKEKVSKVPSRNILHQKGAVNNFENAGRGCKGKRMPCSNVSKGSHPLPRKREKHCLEGQLNTGSLANGNKTSTSLKADEHNEVLVGTFTKSAKKCGDPLTLNDRLHVREELKDYLDFTPIARRTRHFKTVHQRKQDGTLCRAGDTNRPFGGDVSRDTERDNIPISHIKRLDVEKLQEECNIRSPAKDVFSHPKRRRTCQNISGSGALNNNPNLKNQLSPVNEVLTTAKPLTRQRKRTFIKSVCGIRDLAIQKKRSAFMHKASYFDMMAPITEKLPRVFGVRTRSSMNSFSFKHHPENVGECSVESICREAGLVDAIHNDSIAATSDRAHNTEATSCVQDDVSISHANDEGKCAKLEQTPKEKVPLSTLTCTTQLRDADAVSPVCVTQDLPRISSKKGSLMSSLARELSRLDATSASPTQISKDLRRRKDMSKVCVLFSHHLDEDIIKQQKKILTRLGAHVASSMLDATHFVADKFVRTRNMLEAVALGKPVVSHMWLESCGQTSCFIDEKSYILRDLKKEKEIGFIMPVSLARSSQSPLLQGKRVFITPNVKPSQELVVNLVKAAQGLSIERIGRNTMKNGKLPEDLLVLSCEEDYAICIPLLEKGAKVFSSELILNGIVIQKLEYERHRLFLEHVKRTRSTMWLRCEDGSQFIPVTKCS
ncbi:hypothetical protein J5N97_017606 [Dioscorea zingiberensis]|uniref:BRCT domain-containing protein n=1 Tax=Dioscorea zingiberensis TaxID=325984 RepID=A0A9D5CLP0_9LILI|nr:hypothetical protein J5N97_017606 [Dioscorea zingiberensis]